MRMDADTKDIQVWPEQMVIYTDTYAQYKVTFSLPNWPRDAMRAWKAKSCH